ncbi:MAG TPA: hypothetical protein VIJ66_10895, partial [Solirubrobacteraceae bacterium]
ELKSTPLGYRGEALAQEVPAEAARSLKDPGAGAHVRNPRCAVDAKPAQLDLNLAVLEVVPGQVRRDERLVRAGVDEVVIAGDADDVLSLDPPRGW